MLNNDITKKDKEAVIAIEKIAKTISLMEVWESCADCEFTYSNDQCLECPLWAKKTGLEKNLEN